MSAAGSATLRLFILLRREGEPSGINRIHRLYREEGLAVCKRRLASGVPILVEARPNARWLDFVYDQFANGRRFRVLNIVAEGCLMRITFVKQKVIWIGQPRRTRKQSNVTFDKFGSNATSISS